MAKLLRCRDAGMVCEWEVCATTETEVLTRGAEHAREVHGKTEFSPEEIEQVKAVIREVDSCPQQPQHEI